jgi:hypothetical protein
MVGTVHTSVVTAAESWIKNRGEISGKMIMDATCYRSGETISAVRAAPGHCRTRWHETDAAAARDGGSLQTPARIHAVVRWRCTRGRMNRRGGEGEGGKGGRI